MKKDGEKSNGKHTNKTGINKLKKQNTFDPKKERAKTDAWILVCLGFNLIILTLYWRGWFN